jgi:hypothetical protein
VSHFAVIREAGPGWKVGGITGSEHGRVRVLLIVDAESDAEIHHRLADDPWVPTRQLVTVSIEPWKLLVGSAQPPS